MREFEGSLALQLDFGDSPGAVTGTVAPGRTGLRLAPSPNNRLTGPDKYRVLQARRRRAQIRARHLLDLVQPGE